MQEKDKIVAIARQYFAMGWYIHRKSSVDDPLASQAAFWLVDISQELCRQVGMDTTKDPFSEI